MALEVRPDRSGRVVELELGVVELQFAVVEVDFQDLCQFWRADFVGEHQSPPHGVACMLENQFEFLLPSHIS